VALLEGDEGVEMHRQYCLKPVGGGDLRPGRGVDGEAMTWAGYNVVVYAVMPLAYFRRKYSAEQPNLVSSDRRGDARVIVVVLLIRPRGTMDQRLALRADLAV
jgi:hypothetical protein